MAPRSGSRTYGSVDDPSKARLLGRATSDDCGNAQQSETFGRGRGAISVPGSDNSVTQRSSSNGGRRRWLAAAVACGMALAATTAVMRAGTGVPAGGVEDKGSALSEVGSRDATTTPAGYHAAPGGKTISNNRVEGAAPPGASAAPQQLAFTALNFYHIRDGKPGQDYPWLKDMKLIEPHRDTTLTVTNARDGFDYRWEVRGAMGSPGEAEVQLSATGKEVTVQLTKLDENMISVEEVNDEGVVTRRLDENVMVKYVRREIRTLAEEERVDLLDSVRNCSVRTSSEYRPLFVLRCSACTNTCPILAF